MEPEKGAVRNGGGRRSTQQWESVLTRVEQERRSGRETPEQWERRGTSVGVGNNRKAVREQGRRRSRVRHNWRIGGSAPNRAGAAMARNASVANTNNKINNLNRVIITDERSKTTKVTMHLIAARVEPNHV